MAGVRGTGPGGERRPAGARRRGWSRRIEEALRRDLFVLHAQRIVEVASGDTLRHELFLRMAEGRGLIPAGEFVVAAEKAGSIREIDRWVMSRAIQLAAAGHPVDLNLSVRSADAGLLELMRRGVGETGADPTRLVIELSEEQLVKDLEAGSGFVRGAHEIGCRIALDGYIRGGRGRALLKGLPIDFVKLGPLFVNGLVEDGRRRRKARNATGKAHDDGLRVIAQGVEDLLTLQLLPDLGIDEAQGFALGAPEPVESALPAPA
ncbi:MAG TPA: EAL domain-containing protein [Solirubrobacterales bacterium]|jgi:EAL domain-containing protein (putative c-di-GMP-specific phosphodiesterase class I)|nr:EAL domain-containing protein [Solirubrobacterales bacterium]